MRKSTIPSALQKLTEDKLGEVHSWFKRHTYEQILARLRDQFGIKMTKSQLGRYYQRFAEAQLFNAVLWTPLTPADMIAIKNAGPISASGETGESSESRENAARQALADLVHCDELKKHCIRIARGPKISVSTLMMLHQVATYDQRRELKEREQLLEAQKLGRLQEYRRRLQASKQRTP